MEADGYVYVGGDGHLLRLDSQSGSYDQNFKYPPDDGVGAIYGKPVVMGDTVYAAGFDCTGNRCEAQVFAVDAETGQSAWAEGNFNEQTRLVGGVAVNESTLVFGTTRINQVENPKGYLYALDPTPDAGAADQIGDRFRWRISVDQSIWGQPVIHENVAYFGTLAGTLYAVDLGDDAAYSDPQNRVLWTFEAEGIVNASPVIQDGKIYFGDFANNFYSLDLATRESSGSDVAIDPSTEWVADVGGWVWAAALINDGTVYVGTLGGKVYALDLATGDEVWDQPGEIDGQVVARPAIVQAGSVPTLAVPSSDQDVHILTLLDGANTGRRYDTNDGVMAEPLFLDGSGTGEAAVFVHSLNDEIRRFHPSSLNILDCFKLGDGGRC